MPSWKKVITSGSDAELNSLYAPSITGSLHGTASIASTASYVNTLRQTVEITGSFNVTGSTLQIGTNTLTGNTILSGSIIISGSTTSPVQPTIKVYGDMETDGVIKFMPVDKNIDTSISASYIYVSGSTNDLYFSQNGSGYNNVTRLRWLEGNLYTGLLHGGLITTASSTTFNISSGSGIIVNLNASLNDDPYPTIQYINWGNLTNQSLTYLTSSIQTFVGINSSGAVIQQTDPWYNGQYNTSLSIGTVLHQNTASINGSITYPNVAYGYKQRTYDFIKAFGSLKLSGYTIYTSSSLGLTVGSGTGWSDGRNYQVDPNNPSYITDPGTNVSKIFRYYVSGSTYIQDTNGGVGYTVIDPANYNNNGVLTPVPGTGANRRWSNQRVFYYPNSVTKGIVVYYGSATYASEIDAAANLQYENFQETPNTQQNAIYLGTIAIRNDGNFTDSTSYRILPGGVFRNVGGSGGGGAVTTTLAGLSDVSIVGPTNGQPLVYSSASLKWENQSTLTANLIGNASTATTASYVLNAVSSSYSETASFVNPLRQDVIITGSLVVSASGGVNDFQVGANKLFVSASGNVGIGTSTPTQPLQVAISGSSTIGGTSLSGSALLVGTINNGIGIDNNELYNAGNEFIIGTLGSNNISFRPNSTPRMVISSSGDVGIGITTPTAKLHVNNLNAGNSFLVEDSTNPDATPFVIDNTGNVGIGKLTPSTTLDISGSVIITGSFDASSYPNKIIAITELTSSTLVTHTVGTTNFTAINLNSDGTNRFAKASFIAPLSGRVEISMEFDMTIVNSSAVQMVGLHNTSSATSTPSEGWYRVNADNDSTSGQFYAKFIETGLTPGTAYNYYFMGVCDFSGNTIRTSRIQTGAYAASSDLPSPLRIYVYDLGSALISTNPSS